MKSILSFLIGIRFSLGCKRKGITSLASIISIVGIALGVAVFIISLSIMRGFKHELKNRILSVIPHGEIELIEQSWNDWNCSLIKIEKLPGIVAAAPYIKFIGLMEGKTKLCAIQIKGISPQREARISTLPKFVQNKAWMNFLAGKQQIIIGKGIAESLKIKLDDWVSVMIPDISDDNNLYQINRIFLHVTGIFQLKSQLDNIFAIVPLEDAQKYLNMKNGVTGIAIKINNILNAEKMVRKAGELINKYVYIKSWISNYGYIYRDIQTIRAIMYLAILLIIGIACLNIISMLIIAIKNRSSDIAILLTLGAKSNFIHAIFIWYGLSVSLLGSLCGALIGIIISLRLDFIVNKIEKIIGHQLLLRDIYFIDFFPSVLNWQDVCCIQVITILLSLSASWYPARRASLIDPVKILNNR